MILGTSFLFGDIDALWPRIAARLRHVDPEEAAAARQACRDGNACCMVSPDGAVVFELDLRPPKTLFVRLAVSFGRAGAFARQEQAMLAIARDIGMAEIAFRASRRGWARLCGPQWQRYGSDEFRRAV